MSKRPAAPAPQRGGFVMGLIVGLLLGLALALAVALYVTKAPVPFVNKVPQRTPEQDAAEAERNKSWDPNAPLAGKPGARPASAPGVPAAASTPPPKASAVAEPAKPARDPAAILSGQEPPRPLRGQSNRGSIRLSTSCRLGPSANPMTPNNSAPSWRCWVTRPR